MARPSIRTAARVLRLVAATCAVIIAVAIVTSVSVSVDLGPGARQYAEKAGSDYLERPLHIGGVRFRLLTGRFLIEDVRIEGRTPESRPFLTAERIEVAIPWGTLFDRRFVIRSIEMTDWRMYIEVVDGKHSMPKLTPKGGSGEPRSWTTTLEWVRAHRGEFTFEDHGARWSVVTRNLDVTVARPGSEYRGQASFSNGTVAIQDYEPFRADMTTTFKLDGKRVVLDTIDLITDGARSKVHGDVNLAFWPEQMFRVESTFDIKRMREIFFARESFRLAGTGHFSGYFHLFKEPLPDGTTRTGRELIGTLRTARADVNQYRFDDVLASVRWTPDQLAVTDASAGAFGGRARFGYQMAPLGVRGVRATARFDARYEGVSLRTFSEFHQFEGLRLDGAASGRVNIEWPLGRFGADRHIGGVLRVDPPAGVTLMTRRVPVELIAQGRLPRGPAAPLAPLIPLPIGAEVVFDIGPDTMTFGPSRVVTQRTYVEFDGVTTTGGEASTIPFFVSSADWRESYRVFAAMMTALGSRTTTVELGGYGTFEGVLLRDIRRPRIEGTFDVERMRAWGVEWGSGRGRAVVENGYADVMETTVGAGDSTIRVDGRFSLGFPRKDGGEELNARVRLLRRPVADLREAFGLGRYPVDGLLSGEFHVYGHYRSPQGYGTIGLTDGRAYGEPFESATAAVGLVGTGVRLTAIEVAKGGGRGHGAAYVDWDSGYSFDFAGDAIPIESVSLAGQFEERVGLPLSGLIDFTASGSGRFDMPRYTVDAQIRDLFAGDEGIGQVVGQLGIVGDMMTVKADVASPRLAVGMSGWLELTGALYADLHVTVSDTSLDPYVRALDPRLSPFTTAVVSGGVHVVGELTNPDALQVEARVDQIELRLFDYALQNPSPFTIAFDRSSVRITEMLLEGQDTMLRVSGVVGLTDERLSMDVTGTANLAVLQGFVRNIRSSGQADLVANLSGPLRDPIVTGTLRAEHGRIRHFGAPQALDNITGTIAFDSRGVTLDGLTATLGRGPVQFGGRIDKQGYLPGQLGITMSGQNMRVSFPQGMQSVVDTALTLQGTIDDMRLGGEVVVRDALYARPFPSNLFEFIGGDDDPRTPSVGGTVLPLTYDAIHIVATSSIRVQNTGDISARLTASADLELRGTYERPVLSGEMELDGGGQFTFLGKRYALTQGTVFFNNPTRIEPSFDLEAETRVRVPGETYQVTASISGTWGDRLDRLSLSLTSDPSLPEPDIFALLLSDVAPSGDVELRQYRGNAFTQQQILQDLAARAATGALSSRVSSAVERYFGVDAFRITPSLADPNQQSSRLEPGARLLIGKQLSPRAYLTYSRSLSSSNRDEIILLEYDYTDRFSWILSRNEDQTYALEVRRRHAF